MSWYENFLDKQLNKAVHTFIGNSKCCAETLRIRPNFRSNSNIKFIYNGVDTKTDNEKKLKLDLRKEIKN